MSRATAITRMATTTSNWISVNPPARRMKPPIGLAKIGSQNYRDASHPPFRSYYRSERRESAPKFLGMSSAGRIGGQSLRAGTVPPSTQGSEVVLPSQVEQLGGENLRLAGVLADVGAAVDEVTGLAAAEGAILAGVAAEDGGHQVVLKLEAPGFGGLAGDGGVIG